MRTYVFFFIFDMCNSKYNFPISRILRFYGTNHLTFHGMHDIVRFVTRPLCGRRNIFTSGVDRIGGLAS